MGIPKILIIIGLGFVALGVAALGAQRVPWVYNWFGHLPGDIRYEGDRTFIYAPIASMLVLSIILSGIVWIIQRLLGR